ncbi:hypothetical protein HNY73_010033 [Argiope bruennichi]|uniref:Uncharacterized protein n=1 Tax=Argiope bruennichi TaxID=94029 RepID=A0A8T0F1Y4_ARGBR|nr:hypothetical protein HNY73_010033 [Argiope bruennichi]
MEWQVHRTQEKAGRVGCPEMHAHQAAKALEEIRRVEALIFDACNSLPECYGEVKKFAYGVLTIFGSTYSYD